MPGTSLVATLVKPSGSALGADIEGVDLGKPLDAATVRAIRDAWFAHLVLRFRRQKLTDSGATLSEGRRNARGGPL